MMTPTQLCQYICDNKASKERETAIRLYNTRIIMPHDVIVHGLAAMSEHISSNLYLLFPGTRRQNTVVTACNAIIETLDAQEKITDNVLKGEIASNYTKPSIDELKSKMLTGIIDSIYFCIARHLGNLAKVILPKLLTIFRLLVTKGIKILCSNYNYEKFQRLGTVGDEICLLLKLYQPEEIKEID